MMDRVEALLEEARIYRESQPDGLYHYLHQNGSETTGKFPHPTIPGSHAEVYATDRLLKRRYGPNRISREEFLTFLSEIWVDNISIERAKVIPKPACANRSRILFDVDIEAGKLWEFPPTRGPQQ